MNRITPPSDNQLTFDRGGSRLLSVMVEESRPSIVAGDFKVIEHESVGSVYMRLVIASRAIADTSRPGQFVMLTAAKNGSNTPALPRPMAIYATDQLAGTITIVYAMRGRGTRRLAEFVPGEGIYIVGPLGRAFDIHAETRSVLLVGRGIGTCSLTTVSQHNARNGIDTFAVTSAQRADLLVGADFYREQGVAEVLEVTDEDETSHPARLAVRLTELFESRPPQLVLTCGSNRLAVMCHDLAERWGATVQVSLEAHMACGIGYCHGCASGAPGSDAETPLVCKDGPVFLLGRGGVAT